MTSQTASHSAPRRASNTTVATDTSPRAGQNASPRGASNAWACAASKAAACAARLFALALCAAALPATAQTPRAELRCTPAGRDLAYACTARLTRGGAPLVGADLSVSADMPSMPMAHNVKPVKAVASATPGEYHFPLELEMQGEWAVRLRLTGPVRDLLVVHLRFTDAGSAPAGPGTRHPHRH